MYDFDGDGKISVKDIRLLLSHIPIVPSDGQVVTFQDRINSQNSLKTFCEELVKFMGGNTIFTLTEFKKIN